MDIIRYSIGPHEVIIEGDLLVLRFVGPYLPDEAKQILTLTDQVFRKQGSVYYVANVTRGDMLGPQTRRVLATWQYLGQYTAVMVGTSLAQRAVLALVSSAQRLLSSKPSPFIHFCATEQAARELIAKLREARLPASLQ
jgi:hypothetical protein